MRPQKTNPWFNSAISVLVDERYYLYKPFTQSSYRSPNFDPIIESWLTLHGLYVYGPEFDKRISYSYGINGDLPTRSLQYVIFGPPQEELAMLFKVRFG